MPSPHETTIRPGHGFDGALQHLEKDLLPRIRLDSAEALVDNALPVTGSSLPLTERLPDADAYPVQGADPRHRPRADAVRVEIVSSAEKADPHRPDRRWLVQVAEHLNRRRERLGGGRRIEVTIRTIPSGLAAQMLMAGKLRPAGYSPASQQWLDLLERQGLAPELISERLVATTTVIAL